jgi:hypothetical protein
MQGKLNNLQAAKRELWPLKKLSNILFLFLALGGGVLLGLVMSLQVMGYFGDGSLLQSFSGAAPSQQQRQRAVHAHVISTKENGYEPFDHQHMPDEVLLWRASMFPHRPGIPIPRTPKVAFLFLTVGPLPLGPLWERFFHGHEKLFNIYVHSLPGFEPDHARSSVFFGRHIPSQETKWGDISMCDAERRLLANALLDYENERFVLVSESCAPLWNFTFTYDYLINSHHSFIGVFDDPGPFGRGRYSEPMLPEVTLGNWRKGAQWFEVNRELAIYIVADTIYYPKFRDFCKPVCYVDEHYLPTMMFIQFAAHLANRSVTAVDWSRGGSHPGIYGHEDAVQYADGRRWDHSCMYNGEPGHICYLFARKFSPNSLEPLLQHSTF